MREGGEVLAGCREESLGHKKRRGSASYFRQLLLPKLCPPSPAQCQPPASAGKQGSWVLLEAKTPRP